MRNTIIPQFKNALPSDLVSNIKETTIWTNNGNGDDEPVSSIFITSTQDTIYLLAEFEVFGTRSQANQYE